MNTREAFLDNNDNESEKDFELLKLTACFKKGKVFEVLFKWRENFMRFCDLCLEIYRVCDF